MSPEPTGAFLPTDTAYKAVDFIETYTGRKFWPLKPEVAGLSIIDIAHHQSNQCRYSGATKFFYSTAQHCCLLAEHVSNKGASALDALQILMHDAPESYLVDIPRPVKQFMPEYRVWDKNINDKIREWMGWTDIPFPSFQDELDSRIIVDERAVLFPNSGNDWGHDLQPVGVSILKWTPEEAEKTFLMQYAAYSREVYGSYQYINAEWGIPVKVYHDVTSDQNIHRVDDLAEVDIRGGVGRLRRRGEDGILTRDPTAGRQPRADTEWWHGKFTLQEKMA